MKKASLIRFYKDPKETLGTFGTWNVNEVWVCKTLERPDNGNQPQTGCIPEGIYICKETWSPKHNRMMYEITGIPGRSGVRFDVANFASQLLGCVCMGDAHKDINSDGELDVIHSGATIAKFENIMNHEPFELTVSYQPLV